MIKHEGKSYKTKKAMAGALKELMRSKPFSKITVGDITSACKINRKTFYYHFPDIRSLLKWIFQEEAVSAVQKFSIPEDCGEALGFAMDYIDDNEYIIWCACDAIGQEEVKSFFTADFRCIIEKIISAAEKSRHKSLKPDLRSFLVTFYSEAISGSLLAWMRDRTAQTRQDYIDSMIFAVTNSLYGILSACPV